MNFGLLLQLLHVVCILKKYVNFQLNLIHNFFYIFSHYLKLLLVCIYVVELRWCLDSFGGPGKLRQG
jgi:hypothetical protein